MSTLIKENGVWKTVANLSQSDVIRNPDWSKAVVITAAQLNAGYTAPSDGMFVGRWVNSNSAGAAMTVNGVIVGVASNNTSGMLQCSVSSGDVIKNNGTTGTSEISFVPYKVSIAEGLITDEIEVASVTLGSNFTGTVSVKKRLGTVTVTLLDLRPVSKTGSTAIFTLPDGFKPASTDFGILWSTGNEVRIINVPANTGIIEVGGDGVTSWFDEDTPKHLWGTVTFIAAV